MGKERLWEIPTVSSTWWRGWWWWYIYIYIYIHMYVYLGSISSLMQISLNIIDILCLHIFFWIRSNSRITFIVFGGIDLCIVHSCMYPRLSEWMLFLQSVICLFTRSRLHSKVLLYLWAAGSWSLKYVYFGSISSLMQISLNIIDILCLHIFFWIRS